MLLLDEPDEEPGLAHAFRDDISDVDAVLRWLQGTENWVESTFIAAYRDGKIIEIGSDLDPEWSGTLEIGHTLALDASERRALWSLLK